MTKKTKEDKNLKHSTYNFPVNFTWGQSVMENHLTEEARHDLALKAFKELANRKTDLIVRFQFFSYKGIGYSIAVYEEGDQLQINCDQNDFLTTDMNHRVDPSEIN